MTSLTLIRLKPDTSGPVVHKPFSESDDFTDGWWDDEIYGHEPELHRFYSFFVGQHEVARAEVEIQDALNEEYERPAHPGPYAVIHFFETSRDRRRRGYGAEAVQMIAERHADTPLVAFSQDADAFWGSLGWDRYEHGTDPGHHRPMYVSPVHTAGG